MAFKRYQEEHEIFRTSFRKFLEKEAVPYLEEWLEKRDVPRDFYRKMGEQGYLCMMVDEKYGGMGADFIYTLVLMEELCRIYTGGIESNITLHTDIVTPYISRFGTEEQKKKWLPGCCSGEILMAIAMTEPNAGSDLAAIQTTAVRDGDHFILNGQKTFISNGIHGDLCIAAVKTDTKIRPKSKGMSLIVVEDGTAGFIKARKLEKIGHHLGDTAELFFDDCRVPAENLLGEEGRGFVMLMEGLQQERLVALFRALMSAQRMLDITIDYTKTREAFGKPICSFQHNTFKIVEMATEVEMAKAFTYDLVEDFMDGNDITTKVSMAKWYVCELANRVAYNCVQLHGGYGYMSEYEIARRFCDIRFLSIAAGSSEIMKTIIGRRLGLT
jgi:acyl-CoA dehydrogenase